MTNYARKNIQSMKGYVPGEQPPPGKFIKLNTNENPYPPSPATVRAIQQAAETGLARYPDPYGEAFRRAAAAELGVDPDWILCGNGSDDILTICVRTFVGEGERLRYPTPSYVLYKTLVQIQGGIADEIRLQNDWSLPAEFVSPADDVKLAVVANPNSPSGTLLAPEPLLAVAQELPCPLIIDEAYVDFADTHCLDLVKRSDKILVTRSMSKSYALAGLRFGFVVAQPSLIGQLAKVKDSYNCDALSIAGATAAISDQRWLQETTQRVKETRARMEKQLASLGFHVQPSQANFVWCSHPEWDLQSIFESLKASQILVRFMVYDGWGKGLRISVGTDAQFDACFTTLTSIIGQI
jgi:histidinol-phosphate aminotransferase